MRPPARDVKVKHVTNQALDGVVELLESLSEEARDHLLKRWEQELVKFARALIGPAVTEWLNREDQVICFGLAGSAKATPVDA